MYAFAGENVGGERVYVGRERKGEERREGEEREGEGGEGKNRGALINGEYKGKIRRTRQGGKRRKIGLCMNYGLGQIRRRERLYSRQDKDAR